MLYTHRVVLLLLLLLLLCVDSSSFHRLEGFVSGSVVPYPVKRQSPDHGAVSIRFRSYLSKQKHLPRKLSKRCATTTNTQKNGCAHQPLGFLRVFVESGNGVLSLPSAKTARVLLRRWDGAIGKSNNPPESKPARTRTPPGRSIIVPSAPPMTAGRHRRPGASRSAATTESGRGCSPIRR